MQPLDTTATHTAVGAHSLEHYGCYREVIKHLELATRLALAGLVAACTSGSCSMLQLIH
jgi:hypothetical protein